MLDKTFPLVFCNYYAEWRDLMTNVTAKDFFNCGGQTPHFATFGEEETSQVYVNLVGMNGYIIVKQLQNSLFRHTL